jgi:hypothetical protein
MIDLTKQDSDNTSKFRRSFNIIGAEGLFILGIGLGWIFSSMSISQYPSKIAYFLCGLGGLLCFAYLSYRFNLNRKSQIHRAKTGRAVDINDSVKAYRLHGSQVPLWVSNSGRSETIVLTGKQSLLFPRSHSIILEHWEGPEIKLHLKNDSLSMAPQQILQLREHELESWDTEKIRLSIEPDEDFADEDVILLVHLISNNPQ